MDTKQDGYEIVSSPAIRAAALDLLRKGERMHIIHALPKADVTKPRHC
ncbi:MAG: hypothetical protein GTO63_26295 [Anaerolineae bacterium]|nr:hypothetical protein [Anaerolineae bacterium]NIN98246.1 hypothetical protein [Anaerolineae bacterium]NIQ81173.1 hypothetical protein [Anaerolineae bacterium]